MRRPMADLTRRRALTLAATSLAAFGAGGAGAQTAAPCWTTPGRLPHAVQEIYPSAHKGRIHISGGLLGVNGRAGAISPHHMAFDPKTGQTALLAPCPTTRHHPQLIDHKGALYQCGGFAGRDGAVNWIMSTDTYVYDDAANAWTIRASSPVPHGESVAAVLGDRIHFVGGRAPRGAANLAYGDHADTAQHLVFDPAANTWTQAAPAPTARNSAAGALIGGLWHIAGGRTLSGPLDVHEVYDPRVDRWRTAAPMPKGSGAGGNAAGVIDGDLYVFGGEFFEPRPGGVKQVVWRYSAKRDAWEEVSRMPTPRHGLGGVSLDGAIFAVGGAVNPSGNGTSDLVEKLALGC